jgi:hypothetical protein
MIRSSDLTAASGIERSDNACCSVSNSAGFDRCVRSPVCNTKDGCSRAALILAIAARSVAVTSVFAGLSKPMWLSLICGDRVRQRTNNNFLVTSNQLAVECDRILAVRS